MESMRAMIIERTGGPEVFEVRDVPRPSPGPGQVLVRVRATSVNPIDCKVRSGAVAVIPPFPAVLHGDLAGEVVARGPGAGKFREGDRVFGFVGWTGGEGGALAEYSVCDERLLAEAPTVLSFEEAAALPVAGLTAWLGLKVRAGVKGGMRVLVHGAAGGVGHVAVQVARALGAEVSATASSPEKLAIAERLGARYAIDYRKESVTDYVERITAGKGFDVVFDTVGGKNLDASFEAARSGGTVVATAARSTHDLTPVHSKGLSLHVVFVLLPILQGSGREELGAALHELARLASAGQLKPYLDERRFKLADIADAHRLLESGAALGKVSVSLP